MGKRKHFIEIGQRFSRLTVKAQVRISGGSRLRSGWLCECDCGGTARTFASSLARGAATSCGCAHIDAVTKHGHSPFDYRALSPTYKSWVSMRQRCTNENATHFHRYGGRGIKCCERWSHFANFLADMGERPAGTTLDRIDNNGNYEPGNCRWATRKEQAANRTWTPPRVARSRNAAGQYK